MTNQVDVAALRADIEAEFNAGLTTYVLPIQAALALLDRLAEMEAEVERLTDAWETKNREHCFTVSAELRARAACDAAEARVSVLEAAIAGVNHRVVSGPWLSIGDKHFVPVDDIHTLVDGLGDE